MVLTQLVLSVSKLNQEKI